MTATITEISKHQTLTRTVRELKKGVRAILRAEGIKVSKIETVIPGRKSTIDEFEVVFPVGTVEESETVSLAYSEQTTWTYTVPSGRKFYHNIGGLGQLTSF